MVLKICGVFIGGWVSNVTVAWALMTVPVGSDWIGHDRVGHEAFADAGGVVRGQEADGRIERDLAGRRVDGREGPGGDAGPLVDRGGDVDVVADGLLRSIVVW